MSRESIGRHIVAISKYLSYYINKRVEKFNINKTQVEMLMVLYYNEGISQNRLAEELMLDKVTVTKQLDKLIDRGYVKKESGKEDKRTRKLYVTQQGTGIRDELEQILNETTEVLARGFSCQENEAVRQLLRKMSYNIYQEVKT